MASVKDARQLVKHVESALSDLDQELQGDGGDFDKLTRLADEIGERADTLAETFNSMNDVLMGRIRQLSGGERSRNRSDNGRQSSRTKSRRTRAGARS